MRPGIIVQLICVLLGVLVGFILGMEVEKRAPRQQTSASQTQAKPEPESTYLIEVRDTPGPGACYVLLTKTTNPPTPVAISCR